MMKQRHLLRSWCFFQLIDMYCLEVWGPPESPLLWTNKWLIHWLTCWRTGPGVRQRWPTLRQLGSGPCCFLSDWFIHISSWLAILTPPPSLHPPSLPPICPSVCLCFCHCDGESIWTAAWPAAPLITRAPYWSCQVIIERKEKPPSPHHHWLKIYKSHETNLFLTVFAVTAAGD